MAMSSLPSSASHDSRPRGVLQHRRADVVVVDARSGRRAEELAGIGIVGLQQLGVLVVDHRLGDVDAVGVGRLAPSERQQLLMSKCCSTRV